MKEGYVTMSRTSSNMGEDYVSIDVHCSTGQLKFEMSVEDFAYAITGLGHIPIRNIRHEVITEKNLQ